MGKSGKARKKRRLAQQQQQQQQSPSVHASSTAHDAGDSDNERDGERARVRDGKKRSAPTTATTTDTAAAAATTSSVVSANDDDVAQLASAGVTPAALATTVRTLAALGGAGGADVLRSRACKPLRVALHPLLREWQQQESSASARVSSALRDGRVADALAALEHMRCTAAPPKLGSVQRWVRDAGVHGWTPTAMRLMHAILVAERSADAPHRLAPGQLPPVRVIRHRAWLPPQLRADNDSDNDKHDDDDDDDDNDNDDNDNDNDDNNNNNDNNNDNNDNNDNNNNNNNNVNNNNSSGRADDGTPAPPPPSFFSQLPADEQRRLRSAFRVVAHERAAERRPPNRFDLDIVTAPAGVVPLRAADDFVASGAAARVVRHDVPTIPGAFHLSNVLDADECRALLTAADAAGFHADQPIGLGDAGERAAACVWLVEPTLCDAVFERCRALLPQTIDGAGELLGINARWRFYRYNPRNIYGPHVDGAWPGSGVDADGAYRYDLLGDRWSHLTFLLYLNDDFCGGETSFFLPSPHAEHTLDVWPVRPVAGSVLVFPHGASTGALVHEGSRLRTGHKYIVRTECLYRLPVERRARSTAATTRHLATNAAQDEQRRVEAAAAAAAAGAAAAATTRVKAATATG